LDELKLRGSWGQLGFDGNTPPNNQFTLFNVDPALANYAITGSNTKFSQGLVRLLAIRIPDGKDEQTDIGLDGSLWNSKLYFSADYFFKKSDGLLFPTFGRLYWVVLQLPLSILEILKTRDLIPPGIQRKSIKRFLNLM
jgi:hypothetical protein